MQFLDNDAKMNDIFLLSIFIIKLPTLLRFQRYFKYKHPCKNLKKPKETTDNHEKKKLNKFINILRINALKCALIVKICYIPQTFFLYM